MVAILETLRKLADWQIANLDGKQIRKPTDRTLDPGSWELATLYRGLVALAVKDPTYLAVCNTQASAVGEKLTGDTRSADQQANGNVLLALDRTANVEAQLRKIMASRSTTSLSAKNKARYERWWWCDALFMALPLWISMSEKTKDTAFIGFAIEEAAATIAYLYDEKERLFHRDSNAFGTREYWSRGNGWAFAALAISTLHTPLWARLVKEMADKLLTLQCANGFWTSAILTADETKPETSGTALIVMGLATAIRSGVLVDRKYRDAAEKGWAALLTAVNPAGRLGYVQQVGEGPGDVRADDTQFYGVGVALLAGCSLLEIGEP